MILQDDLKSKLHEENSDFKATNRNEENTLFLDTIDTSTVFKRETSNTLDIIDGTDTHEDDLNHLLFKTVQAQLKVQSTNTNNSTNNAASSLSSLQPKKIQLIANNTEFGDFSNFLLAYCMKRKKIIKREEVKNLFYIFSAEYPWQVAILKKEEFDNVYVCGGALIDGSHILTAAHSIKDYKPEDLRYLSIFVLYRNYILLFG